MYFQGHALLQGRSVVAPEDFFQSCVLPLFSPNTNSNTDVHLKDVLQLLLTTFQCRDDIQWMSDNEIFATMLCLCKIIDEYKIKKAEDETNTCMDIESIAISCLSYGEKSVLLHRSARTGISLHYLSSRIQRHYRPQTKFGARLYFHRHLSFC